MSEPELADWRDAIGRIVTGLDAATGIYEQFAGYHNLEPLELGTARLIVAEISFRRRTRELVRQKGEQRHYIGLFDYLRPLRSLAADHHVDRHLAVGVRRQIEARTRT